MDASESVPSPSDPVGSVTAFDVAEASPGDHLDELARKMRGHSCGALLVRGRDGSIGVITERDLVEALAADHAESWATDVMSRKVITADASTSIAEAGRVMVEAGIRHLVITESGREGIVSMRDVMPALLAALD